MRDNFENAIRDLCAAPYGSRIKINSRYILIKDHRDPRIIVPVEVDVIVLYFRLPSGYVKFKCIPIEGKQVDAIVRAIANEIESAYIEFANRQRRMILDNHTFKIEKEFDFNILEL
jgi:hypothetical protein